jgi:hypothetical protein
MSIAKLRKPFTGAASFIAAVALSFVPYACITPAAGDLAAGRLNQEPSAAAKAIDKLTRETCGATWSLVDGNRAGTDVYVVSVYPEAGRAQQFNHFPSAGEIERFMAGNQILLQDPLNNVGTYCEYDRGDCHKGDGAMNCYLDISRTTKDKARAVKLARSCNQRSIAFLGKKSIDIIDKDGGKPFGDGRDLSGAALKKCASDRDSQ